MKKQPLFIWTILLSINFSLTAQEITLKGQVSIHNSKYETGTIEYVQDAYVKATFAGVVDTDVKGNFSLTFSGIEEGTTVEIDVEKAGLEVVNKKDLQEVVIGRLIPLKIYLAPKGQIAKARVELYNVSIKTLTQRHDRLIASLRKDDAESKNVIKDLEEKLNVEINNRFEAEEILNKQLDATRRRLPEFTQKLSKVNLDFASKMYKEAYEYFKAGEIEKAIETIDEAVLDKQAKESVESINQLRLDINNLDTAFTYSQDQINELVKSYYLQAKSLEKNAQIKAARDTLYNAIPILLKVVKGKKYRNLNYYNNAAFHYKQEGVLEKEFYCLKRALEVGEVKQGDISVKDSVQEVEIIYLMIIGKINSDYNK